jgi:hypothetical protein
MQQVARTSGEWVVPGTPFSTVTVNNSYSTGVHTDRGDLEAGFSNVSVMRRGNWHGGKLVFPEYRVAVDLKEGDLLLMDAHQWHGNTQMICDTCGDRMMPRRDGDQMLPGWHEKCGSERISIVCYFRTNIVECGTAQEELVKAQAQADLGSARGRRMA